MPLTVGGGVRREVDVRNLLLAGADKVSFNTAAVKDPKSFRRRRKNSARNASSWRLMPSGRKPENGKFSPMVAASRPALMRLLLPKKWRRGGRRNIVDIDGPRRHQKRLRSGTDPRRFGPGRVPVIASGGVGSLDDLVAGVQDGHASAVLAASIFHFGTHTIAEAKKVLADAGIAVRAAPA